VSTSTPRRAIVGTAGHIDHGKTTLVQRLTGVDTDRLPEEKRRGITIVLGFAPLSLPDGTRVGVVDVPGHERFVKNMVAGAGGIDVALFVVAADEGVMPQTREHLEICQLLGIKRGVVALTKVDRAGKDLAELAELDVKSEVKGTFLEDAPIIGCSAVTGEGIDALLTALAEAVRSVPEKPAAEIALLPVDRVFSMKGFGSIITGTLLTGTMSVGDTMEVLPPVPGRSISEPVRVRGIQVFHEKVERAHGGERTAVNLAGVELDQLALGQVIVTPGACVPTQKIAVSLRYLESRSRPLTTGARVLFHSGTALVEAGITLIGTDELAPGALGYAHILLREPIATVPGQHFIARGFDAVESAGRTVAGGVIVDPHPGRRKRQAKETVSIMDELLALATHGPGEGRLSRALSSLVRERAAAGISIGELAKRLGLLMPSCEKAVAQTKGVLRVDDRVVEAAALEALALRIAEIIAAYHKEHPYKAGMAVAEVASRIGPGVPAMITERAAEQLIAAKKLVRDADGTLRSPRHSNVASTGGAARTKVLQALEAAKLEPPAIAELEALSGLKGNAFKDLLSSMVKAGDAVHAAQQLYFARAAFDDAKTRVLELLKREGSMSAAQAKELLGVSRKFLIPLLEAMDKQQITVRVGEVRKAKR
jgi:selenocysteine-specific elongation factor